MIVVLIYYILDHGSQFDSKVFQEFCEERQVQLHVAQLCGFVARPKMSHIEPRHCHHCADKRTNQTKEFSPTNWLCR